jgi:hypothetical protein
MMPVRRTAAVLSTSLLALAMLGACASDSSTDAATQAASSAAAACPLTVADPWVKATDAEMTGGFGVVSNSSDADVTVASAASPAAGMMEIHEVVDKDGQMVMQPKAGGLVVPAGGSAELEPGSDHLMLMKLSAPIEAGDQVQITLTCATGGEVAFTAVAKPFEGGAETYVPAEGSMGSTSMSPSPAES